MKKTMAFIGAALLALAIGCGGSSKKEETTPAATEGETGGAGYGQPGGETPPAGGNPCGGGGNPCGGGGAGGGGQ